MLYILAIYRPEIQIVYKPEDDRLEKVESGINPEYFSANILKQNNLDAKSDQDDAFVFSF